MSLGDRIQAARKAAGLTQQQLADRFGISRNAVSMWESDKSAPDANKMAPLAEMFGVGVEELWTGRRPLPRQIPRARTRIAIAGYVGAGATVIPIDDHARGAGIDYVEIPPSVVGARVRGDSQLPVYRNNDVILYQRDSVPPSQLIGRECMVQLAEPDGRLLLKTIRRGPTPRTFTLASHNARDIEGVRIEWAAPVLWVKRG